MLVRHLRHNITAYFLVFIALGAGVWWGTMNSPLAVDAEMAKTLLGLLDSKPGLTLMGCLINQLPWWLILALLGLTVVGVLLVLPVIFFKGYCVGYTVYTLARLDSDVGMGFALTAVLGHNLFYIPCLLVIAVEAIALSRVLFRPVRDGGSIITTLFKYLIVVLLAGAVMILGAVVECWVTPWLLHWW